MSSKIWIGLAVFAMISSFPALGVGVEEPTRSESWTILVYMNGDCNDLESYMIDDLNELEQVGSSESVNIVVQIDRREGEDSSNGDWTDTRRYLVEEDDDPVQIASTRLDDPPLGELNMGDPDTFSDFLEFGFSEYPADRYMVSVGGHSDGVTGGVCEDITDGNTEMTLAEFSGAFRESVDVGLSGPVDVLTMDVCRMGMAEAASEVMDHSDYFIAAFDDTPAAGWPYDISIPFIVNDALTMEEKLTGVVDGFVDRYSDEFSYASLSAVDLKGFREGFIPAWRNLSEEMFFTSYRDRMIYSAARNSADRAEADPTNMDAYHFASLLTTNSRLDSRVAIRTNQFLGTEDDVIVHSGTGPGHNPESRVFGVKFPTSGIRRTYLESRFSSMTPWDEFLNAFVNELDSNPVGINWTEGAPGEVTFELTSATPENIQSVVAEVDSGSGTEEINLPASGGYYHADHSDFGTAGFLYRYRVRTVFGDDVYYPPDGYSQVSFTEESGAPEIFHSPPFVVNAGGSVGGLEFHLRDDSGIDLSSTILHYREVGEDSWFSVPLRVKSYEKFRGWLRCAAFPEWIDPGSSFEYYLETADVYGNPDRSPDSGYWQSKLGAGNRFYVDIFHSDIGPYSRFLSAMNGSGLTLDMVDSNIDPAALNGYKVYVLMSPDEPLTGQEVNALMGFVDGGGELLLVMDPSDGIQRLSSGELVSEMGIEPVNVGINDYYPYDPSSELGDDLPTVVGNVEWSFSADNRSEPVYYTSDNNLALGTQWRGYGRMVFGISDLFDDNVMERGSNKELASLVIGYLSRNMRPVLDYSVDPPDVVEVGEPVVLDMSGSSDPDGEIVTYSVLIGGNEFMEGPDPVMEYTFAESGVFPAVLTVTDNEGGESSATISIRSNRPPSEGIGVTKTEAYAGEEILFDYKGSDPDGDEVTVLWDFGDGSIRNGRTVSYQYNNKGMYEVTVTVRDSAGMEINMTRNILIRNSDPEAEMDRDGIQVNNGPPTFTGDMRVTLELFEGDQILISGAPTTDADRGDSLNYTWSLDGRVIGDGVILDYRFRESGLHTLNLTVDDGYGGVGQDQLTVMVFNNPPTAFAEARVDGNSVIFDASASSDDSWDSDLTYVWDFGDGEEKETRDPSVEHRYRFGGTYTVNLTVVDPDGDKGYHTLKVRPDGMRLLDWVIIAAVILVIAGVVMAGILVYLRKGPSGGNVETRVFSGSREDEGGEPEMKGFSKPAREHRARSIKDLGDERSKD